MSDYTQLEWLQIGVFLFGLPIAVVLGALVGLVGKWKQGRVLVETLRHSSLAIPVRIGESVAVRNS